MISTDKSEVCRKLTIFFTILKRIIIYFSFYIYCQLQNTKLMNNYDLFSKLNGNYFLFFFYLT